ncbi:MAG: aminotransferase class V-fold PLP-dependent enzyme [Candidatus Aminicenantes bacterium]|nr:aminotransferase class V-fold PLP-dependent enzyme [Candidatus Aminicenantes bacterium]
MCCCENDLDFPLEEVRYQFKLLNHQIFLNVADQSMPGNYWLQAVRDFFDFQECGRMEDVPNQDIATHPFLMAATYEAIERCARLIGAHKEEVTLMYRPLQAFNLIVNDMLEAMQEWRAADNVVFTDLTYPSAVYVFMGLRDRCGVELRCVKNVDGEILIEDLEKAVDERTRLVAINRTTPFCGFTYNVKEVCRIAHKVGALVMDDAFQAVGAIDVDVHDDDVDFLVTGSYKWQNGPEGAGIFYIRRDLIEKINPRYRNYLAIEMPKGIPFSLADHDNVQSWDYPQIQTAQKFSQDVITGPSAFGWLAALKFIEKLGIKNIEKRVRKLGQYLIEGLRSLNVTFQCSTDPEKVHGLITYTTGGEERDQACFERFNFPPIGKKPIKVSLRMLGGVGGIRVSPHYYNTVEEIDTFLETQGEILASMRKK